MGSSLEGSLILTCPTTRQGPRQKHTSVVDSIPTPDTRHQLVALLEQAAAAAEPISIIQRHLVESIHLVVCHPIIREGIRVVWYRTTRPQTSQ